MMVAINSGVNKLYLVSQRNCRYDGQIAVFGTKLQEMLGKQRYFLVSLPNKNTLQDLFLHLVAKRVRV